ncbi:MAG: glucose 1-dehydrogenase [Alphaproteobacteria bacterium]
MRGLAGKRVLVTGGATGIGKAAVERFAVEGARVVLNYVGEPGPADAVASELCALHGAGRVTTAGADVSDADAVEDLFDRAGAALGGLDIVINNAGIKSDGRAHDIDMDDFDRVMAVNLRGAFLCARAAVRHFLDQGTAGVVVTTSSIHQVVPLPEATSYMMSKAGIGGLTTSLALTYAKDGIRVVAVGPGAIMTPMNDDLMADRAAAKQVSETIPMGRIGEPEEIASVIAFLASDEASYITGQTIYADGGLMIR